MAASHRPGTSIQWHSDTPSPLASSSCCCLSDTILSSLWLTGHLKIGLRWHYILNIRLFGLHDREVCYPFTGSVTQSVIAMLVLFLEHRDWCCSGGDQSSFCNVTALQFGEKDQWNTNTGDLISWCPPNVQSWCPSSECKKQVYAVYVYRHVSQISPGSSL